MEQLVLGNALLARVDPIELAAALEALPRIRSVLLRSHGSFEARAVSTLLYVQRRLLARDGRTAAGPFIEVV